MSKFKNHNFRKLSSFLPNPIGPDANSTLSPTSHHFQIILRGNEYRLKHCEKRGMMKTDKNLNVVTELVLSLCMLFPGRKYLSRIANFHPLIREQSFYCQSSSPCKPFRLNAEYKYLQLLLPCCTYHGYSHTYLSGNQTERKVIKKAV